MLQERFYLAQLRDPSHEILPSAVMTSEQAESTIRVHRRLCCQLNCHTETNRLACRCRTKAANGSQHKLPITPWQTRQLVHQADGNQLQPMPDASTPAILDCRSSAQSIENTRPDLPTQPVSRQLLIRPTTIHTQITTNQLPNKGVVSFQHHFSEQLHNLKSAQQEGASSL